MYALRFLPSEGSLELARDRFIAQVRGLSAIGSITIVFDGRGSREKEAQIPSPVRVIYGSEPLDADGTILTLIRRTAPSARSNIAVVTRDLLLRDRIFSYGSIVISPEAFWAEHRGHLQSSKCELFRNTKNFYRPFKDFFEQTATTTE